MKPRRHFRPLMLLVAILFTSTLIPLDAAASDEKGDRTLGKKGQIHFDFPEALQAKAEVNVSSKLIGIFANATSGAKSEFVELVEMLEGIYVRTYDTASIDVEKVVSHYKNKLKQEQWDVLVKLNEEGKAVQVSLLSDADSVRGIFIIVASDPSEEVLFVNIFGNMDSGRIGELLGNLDGFGLGDDVDMHQVAEKIKKELSTGDAPGPALEKDSPNSTNVQEHVSDESQTEKSLVYPERGSMQHLKKFGWNDEGFEHLARFDALLETDAEAARAAIAKVAEIRFGEHALADEWSELFFRLYRDKKGSLLELKRYFELEIQLMSDSDSEKNAEVIEEMQSGMKQFESMIELLRSLGRDAATVEGDFNFQFTQSGD